MTWNHAPRPVLLCWLAFLCLGLTSCTSDGHFSVLGYSTKPNYDPTIRTVRVPILKNETYRRGLEFDQTRAIIREIEAKTTFKVVNGDCADTELTGVIKTRNKAMINFAQDGLVRDAEVTLTVEFVWRDLRPGHHDEFLSGPPQKPGAEGPQLPRTGAAPVVVVQAQGGFRPELGESITTAEKQLVDRLAVQVVSMMEKPW